jgi:phage terminase large subunit GpA-like protein
MDSPFSIVAIMGPSQMGKSEVGNNWQLHSVLYDPADIAFYSPTKELTASYVTTQINKLLEECPDVKERQLSGASADNIFLKQFKGCDWHFLWPTGPNFRARPFSRGRQDDYDDFPDDIGDQGDAVTLFRGRTTSFLSYGYKLYVNSSPKKGPKRGIEPLVAGGTAKRRWVDCLQCREPFELAWERLQFKGDGTPLEAKETAEVVCPSCGFPHRPETKAQLLATGRYVGKGQHAVSFATGSNSGVGGELEPNAVDSYYWDGLFGFAPWPVLAEEYRAAELMFEEHQDEGPLKSFFQTKVGRNYVSRASGDAPVTVDALQERANASTYKLGQVPDGVLAITMTVDLGIDRFSVAAIGHGINNRAWVIDRFDILTLNDGTTKLEPFRKREHWAVLREKVLARTYPLQRDPSLRMKVFCTGVDTGGSDDATDNAFAWWHDMVARGIPPTAITLLKGGNKPKGRLLPPPTVDAKRQIPGMPECELWIPNVNRVKSIADFRMRRPAPGPAFIGLPVNMDPKHIGELRAEDCVDGLWEKEEGKRNETWDLLVYALVVMLRLVGLDPNLSKVPAWARPPRPSAPQQQLGEAPEPPAPSKAPVTVTRQAPQRPAPRPRRGIRIIRPS